MSIATLFRDIFGRSGVSPTFHLEDLLSKDNLLKMMRQAAEPTRAFFLMLAFSAAIAVLGLLSNSAPSIIGAMIIAPLMSPIMSVSYGITIGDRRLVLRSVFTLIMGTLTVIVISFAGVLLVKWRVMGSEILSRTEPTLLDLGVALAAGGAAAFAHTRRSIATSLAGVAIAVALVPPLAVTGIGLATGAKAVSVVATSLGAADIAFGSFLLFLTNLAGIVAVAVIVFTVQGYGSWRRTCLSLGAFGLLSVLLIFPLKEAMYLLWVKNRVLRITSVSAGRLADSSRGKITGIYVTRQDGVVFVRIEGFIPENRVEHLSRSLQESREIISEDVGEPIHLELDVIPVRRISIEAKPPDPPPAEGGD